MRNSIRAMRVNVVVGLVNGGPSIRVGGIGRRPLNIGSRHFACRYVDRIGASISGVTRHVRPSHFACQSDFANIVDA